MGRHSQWAQVKKNIFVQPVSINHHESVSSAADLQEDSDKCKILAGNVKMAAFIHKELSVPLGCIRRLEQTI